MAGGWQEGIYASGIGEEVGGRSRGSHLRYYLMYCTLDYA